MKMKTLEELNLEFMSKEEAPAEKDLRMDNSEPPQLAEIKAFPVVNAPEIGLSEARLPQKRRSKFAIVSGILLGLAILLTILSVLTSSEYSFFTVLTTSMQDEIPKGSLILVRREDPSNLKTGDNITFMRDWKTSVTHKIIDIYENYEDTGVLGFRTKGTNNEYPDAEIVYAENIVGKVVYTLPGAGNVMAFLGENNLMVIAILAFLILATLTLSIMSRYTRAPVAEKLESEYWTEIH